MTLTEVKFRPIAAHPRKILTDGGWDCSKLRGGSKYAPFSGTLHGSSIGVCAKRVEGNVSDIRISTVS
jgi:hypothetical protein